MPVGAKEGTTTCDLADARAAIAAARDRLNQALAKSLARRFGRDVAETLETLLAESGIRT
jgi:hypothetical protein